jgi:hypothetical protein
MASCGGERGLGQPAANARMRAAGNSAFFMPAQYS